MMTIYEIDQLEEMLIYDAAVFTRY
jgi:hypothetical protein